MDINPASCGHMLVIPKAHCADLYDTPDDELGSVMSTLRKVAIAVNSAIQPDGLSIIQANGPGAAQSVMHYHCHVVPRWHGDELRINWDLVPGDMEMIRETSERIRRQLD